MNKPKSPLIIFLGLLVLTAGCSDKKAEAGDASGQPEQQESTRPSDVNWATGAAQPVSEQASPPSAESQAAPFEGAYVPPNPDPAAQSPQNTESQESAASSSTVPDDPATAARKKVEEYQGNEAYILKYIEKVEKRLETEQDPNFRAGYERGLEQARENYVTNHQDLEAAQKELAAASKSE